MASICDGKKLNKRCGNKIFQRHHVRAASVYSTPWRFSKFEPIYFTHTASPLYLLPHTKVSISINASTENTRHTIMAMVLVGGFIFNISMAFEIVILWTFITMFPCKYGLGNLQ